MPSSRAVHRRVVVGLALVQLVTAALDDRAFAARGNGRVAAVSEFGPGVGGFSGTLVGLERFPDALGSLGDLDGDGVPDLLAAAGFGHSGDQGRLWAIFMNADGTVKADREIGSFGGFTGTAGSMAAIGDLDGDGITEVAVGTPEDSDGAEDAGAVWILFLNADATVKAAQKISMGAGGFTGSLVEDGYFGHAVSALGDVDGDGVRDLAVSAPYYPERVIPNDGNWWRGQVWILLLNADGTVKANQEIADGEGGFTGTLVDYELFGQSLAGIGDLDDDGTPDLAVGAEHNPDGGPFVGAVYVLFLNPDGTVKSQQRISPTSGGFTGDRTTLRLTQHFGHSLTSLGDVDEDGNVDVAVGHEESPVWVLFLNDDGTVKAHRRIDAHNGWAMTGLGDLDGDGIRDWAVSRRDVDTMSILFGDGHPDPLCGSAPLGGCEEATAARVQIRRKGDGSGNRFYWRWRSKVPGLTSLGDPTSTTAYALCVWDESGGTPIHAMSLVVPPGAGWTSVSSQSFKYRDTAGAAAGVVTARLSRDASGQARLILKAKGSALPLSVPVGPTRYFSQDPDVTAELVNSEGGCWSAELPTGTGTSSKYSAKIP